MTGELDSLGGALDDLDGLLRVIEWEGKDSVGVSSAARRFVRSLRDFYSEFFQNRLGLRVTAFSYSTKRRVSRALIAHEYGADDGVAETWVDVGSSFEQFSDVLHGPAEFGYSDDGADYAELLREVLPQWLEQIARLAREDGHGALAGQAEALIERFDAA